VLDDVLVNNPKTARAGQGEEEQPELSILVTPRCSHFSPLPDRGELRPLHAASCPLPLRLGCERGRAGSTRWKSQAVSARKHFVVPAINPAQPSSPTRWAHDEFITQSICFQEPSGKKKKASEQKSSSSIFSGSISCYSILCC